MNPSTGDLGSIQVGIALDIANLQKQMAQVVGEFKAFGQKIDDSVSKTQASILRQYTTAVERQNRLAQQQADRQIREQRRAAQEIEREQKRHADAMLRMNSMIGGAAGRAGMVGVAGLGVAAKEASEFDTAMRYANTVMGLSEKQFASFRGEVLKFAQSSEIRRSPKELADALFWIASAGYTGQKALDILRVSAVGAQGGMVETTAAAKALTSVIDSGIPGVKNAAQAMDVIHQTVLLGKMQFGEYASNIGRVDSLAAQAGVTLQETGAAIAAMTRRGMSGAEAFTSFNSILAHLVHPSRAATEVLNQLGIAHGVTALNARGLTQTLEDMTKASEKDKQKLIEMMPELRGMRGLLTLADRDGRTYTDMLKQMGASTDGVGASNKASAEMGKAFSEQLNLMKKNLDLVAISVGSQVLPEVNKLLGGINNLATGFNNLDPSAKAAWTRIAEVATASALAIGGVSKLAGWVAALNTNFATLGITLSGLKMPAWLSRLGGVALGAAGLMAAEPAGAGGDRANGGFDKDPAIREKQIRDRLSYYKRITNTPPPMRQGWQGMDAQYATPEGFAKAKAERERLERLLRAAQSEQVITPPLGNTAGGGGAKPTPQAGAKGARDAAREREQAIKDAIREAQDERALLARLIAERKQLGLTGYELARFNAQQQFDATMRDAKTPASRAQAALLYQDQVRQAKRERDAAAREKRGYNDFEDRMQEAVDQAEAKRQRGLGLLTQGMGNAYASQQYANQMAEAVAKEIEEQKRAQDEIMEYRRRIGQITNAEYIKFLQERVQAERTFGFGGKETSEQNPEFRAKNLELRQHYSDALESIFGAKGRKGGAEGAKEIAEGMSQGNKYIRQAMEDIGGGALGSLQKALRHGMKGTFGEILAKTLTDLLSTALENAIASAFSKKKKSSPLDIFGGGGLLGSFLSPIESLFGGGRAVQAVSSAAASRGVAVHIHGDNHFNSSVDVQEFGRTLAWQVQRELNRTVGGGF